MRKGRKKRKRTATDNYKLHAKRRSKQRLNIQLNRQDIKDIITQIQSGKAEFIKQSTRTRSLWKVSVKNKNMIVVYSKSTKTIVTVW